MLGYIAILAGLAVTVLARVPARDRPIACYVSRTERRIYFTDPPFSSSAGTVK